MKNKKYRVNVIITMDVEATDQDEAEEKALEVVDFPGATVSEVEEIKPLQPEFNFE